MSRVRCYLARTPEQDTILAEVFQIPRQNMEFEVKIGNWSENVAASVRDAGAAHRSIHVGISSGCDGSDRDTHCLRGTRVASLNCGIISARPIGRQYTCLSRSDRPAGNLHHAGGLSASSRIVRWPGRPIAASHTGAGTRKPDRDNAGTAETFGPGKSTKSQ